MVARLLEIVSVAIQFVIDRLDFPHLDTDFWDER